MSITALYVYSPTTFQSDKHIEPMSGAPHAPGEVRLSPGIYRLPGNANVVAKNGAPNSAYSIVALDTKGGFPDPPQQALMQHNMTAEQVNNFFGGTGKENELS